ncbi:MAG TPA: hypothetical protein VGI12_09580 [Vicinamibacterales bacterium]|jgi:hypothetical protein
MSNLEHTKAAGRGKAVWGGRIRLLGVVIAALAATSCSDAVRTGNSPAYLVLTSLQGAKGGGANSGTFSGNLASDVVTMVNGVSTVFADNGQASLELQMKDVLATPSAANAVTMTQYHVKYIRSDGHNVQGVDVPYEFDGGLGATIGSPAGTNTGSVGFTLVRVQAKQEAPLAALAGGNGQVISTVAEVTLYGRDQNGNAVTVVGRINVDFGNWGD